MQRRSPCSHYKQVNLIDMKIYTLLSHPVIISAVDKLEAFVKSTYGAAGRGVLVDNGFSQTVLDDGFAIVEEFELEDEFENAVVGFIKDTTRKTNKRAGDGTTTSILLAVALIRQALTGGSGVVGASFVRDNYHKIARDYKMALESATEQIRKSAKKIKTVAELVAIAQNSYNNPLIAGIVGRLVHELGEHGLITIEDSETMETTSEVASGFTTDRGYISPYMAGDNGQVVLTNPLIVVTDVTISSSQSLIPLIETALKQGRNHFLFVAEDVIGEALNAMVINKIRSQGNILAIAVRASGYADQRYELLEDLSAVVGAEFVTEKKGRKLDSLSIADCGSAERVVISKDETIIVKGKGSKKAVDARIKSIEPKLQQGSEFEKDRAKQRIAALSSGVGVIKVGAATDAEKRTIKAKVEDAVHATQLAQREGIVRGGGLAFSTLKTKSDLFNTAMQYPRSVLIANGEEEMSDDVNDAVGVIIAALESAVSIATTLITSSGIITTKRDEEKNKETGA